ncbi:hypothetical protein BDQ12DRAFT_685665 [Crucibulum laeve]|uniref:Glutamine synthetase n=1 Tax=Crucibulum laeve TaxID=68775 RepID=A0A5C3LXZ4_9AGAR|nr:hypothetical protein BDQ12DRAFT_685665 [Crucibulum laeve]
MDSSSSSLKNRPSAQEPIQEEVNYSHGVLYSPSAPSTKFNIAELKSRGISYVRIQWLDFTNILRFRVVPVAYFQKLMESSRPGVNIAKASLGLVNLIMSEEFTSMGEYLYVPDLSSIRICPYAPGHASVMGWFEEKTPVKYSDGKESVKVELCSRSVLKRIVEEAKAAGIEFLVGVESEFILLQSTNPIQAVNEHQFSASAGLLSGSVEALVMQEIADAIQESGIELQLYHPEAAPGQYEVVPAPMAPLEAADAVVHVRETIINVAAKHGLRATFAPRVYMSSTGSAAHTHISVHAAGVEKPKECLSKQESYFLAGVLEHLPALPAVTLPIPASYKRVADGAWSGGTYVCWGTENREAPIRLVNADSPGSRRFEMRFIDGTANPYIVLAGILGAGSAGIQTQHHLKLKDCPGPKSAAEMTEEARQALGITKRMPLSWEEARNNFCNDDCIRTVFGDEFIKKYLSVNKILGNVLDVDEDESLALKRLVEFY